MGAEWERSGNGEGVEREWSESGVGMERAWSWSGLGLEWGQNKHKNRAQPTNRLVLMIFCAHFNRFIRANRITYKAAK